MFLGIIQQPKDYIVGINEASPGRYCRGKDPNYCGKDATCKHHQCVPHGMKSIHNISRLILFLKFA